MEQIITSFAFGFPLTENAEEANRLAGVRDRLNEETAENEQEADRIRRAEWSPSLASEAQRVRERTLELLAKSVGFFKDSESLMQKVGEVDFHDAKRAAHSEREAAEHAIGEQLQSIGYEASPVVPNLIRYLASYHPQVKAARIKSESLSSSALDAVRQANAKALNDAEKLLERAKQRAISAL